jgi:hypothetical protein
MNRCGRGWRIWRRRIRSLKEVSDVARPTYGSTGVLVREVALRREGGVLTMTCPLLNDNAEMLMDYCARTLSPDQTAWFRGHMAECPECRSFAEAQQDVWQALDAWDPEPVSLDFNRRLYQRIDRESRIPWWRRGLLPAGGLAYSWLRPALPVALACSLIAGVFLMQSPEAPPPLQREAAGVSHTRLDKVDVEKVERALEDMDMLRQFASAKSAPEAPATSRTL